MKAAKTIVTTASAAVLVAGLACAPASGVAVPVAPVPSHEAAPVAGKVDYSRAIATLRREIPQLMAEGQAVGLTIAMVDGKRTVWTKGFGWANRERELPVTRKTLFHIGSHSKTMTAMAVMQLVERGRVDLDAPLTRYIPGFRMKELPGKLRKPYRDNPVTVRSIMTHHSGIPGDVLKLAEFGKKPERDFYAQALRQLRQEYPRRPVGKAWAYSNMAIQMLQGVVENVSGQSFQRYTRRHIFKPLGMLSTTFDDGKQSWRRIAQPYQVVPDGAGMKTIRRAREYINIRPAGSVYSNAVEMARYLKAMMGFGKAPGAERVLERRTVEQMLTPQPPSPWDKKFWKQGLVWWIGYGSGWLAKVVNHGGDTYFHHTMGAFLPKEKLGVFVSVNTTNPTNVTKAVWQRGLALMVQAKTGRLPSGPPGPKPVVAPDHEEMQAMAGRYANTGGVLELKVEGDALAVTSGAQKPDAPTKIATRRSDGWYTDESGQSLKQIEIDGQKALVARTPDGTKGLMAQRIPNSYSVPRAWRERVGRYDIRGVPENAYPLMPDEPALAELSMYRGVLLLNGSVLRPASGKLAFTFGPSPLQVMRDEGVSIEAKHGHLRYQGVKLVRQPLPATAQALPDDVSGLTWTPALVPQP